MALAGALAALAGWLPGCASGSGARMLAASPVHRAAEGSAVPLVPKATRAPFEHDFNEALSLVTKLRYEEAAEKFSQLSRSYQAGSDYVRAGEAMFWQGYCHEKNRQLQTAAGIYREVIRNFPDTPAARQAREGLARVTGSREPP
jgi:TolA-binding protein